MASTSTLGAFAKASGWPEASPRVLAVLRTQLPILVGDPGDALGWRTVGSTPRKKPERSSYPIAKQLPAHL
jgi:hypothetical protein